MKSIRLSLSLIVLLLVLSNCQGPAVPRFPQKHKGLTTPASYADMQNSLHKLAQKNFIELTVEGQSAGGRDLYLVKIDRNPELSTWKIFFFAQQHGDEPAGKDALLTLCEYIADDPDLLPDDVDLWIMPMVNPDGAEKNRRRNGNGADLNRDHLLLDQPETQALHRVYRRIMPHVSVDCHEFARDSEDYTEQGWLEWPHIMMDCGNNPLFDPALYRSGMDWINRAAPLLEQVGYHYCRYFVGGFPPMEEQRYSTLENNDARNGLGAYGGMSFIIESGMKRQDSDPNADLASRVDAYLHLLSIFIWNTETRLNDVKSIEQARARNLPAFIPTNYFWANKGNRISQFNVTNKQSEKTETIPTANFMQDIIVKKSVPSPRGYLIKQSNAQEFEKLFRRHEIPFRMLERDSILTVRPVRLLRVEQEDDALYARYGGRQITELAALNEETFKTGSLIVSLKGAEAIRAALLLEPLRLYGLYEYEVYRNMVSNEGICPVYRLEGEL